MPQQVGRAWRRGRVSWVWAPLAVTLLAGCGSTSSSDHSRAGLEAAGKDLAANLEAARYRRACEDLTSGARLRLTVFASGGCSGALAFTRGFLAVDGRGRLGSIVERELRGAFRHLSISGDEARAGGVLIARYEQGRWGLEAPGEAGGRRRLRADMEADRAQLRRDGAGELLGELEPGG